MNAEITTSTERDAPTDGEPRLTLTELRALLREATALERAQRPIVIRSAADAFGDRPATTAPAAPSASGVLDFSGRYPSPAEAAGIVAMAPLRRPVVMRHWGVRLGYAGIAAMLAGAADGVLVGTAVVPVAAILAGLGAIAGGVARAVHEQETENGS